MSEHVETAQSDHEVEADSLADNVSMLRPDYSLETLQALANDVGVTIPITLTVGGLVISGDLVSGKDYFESAAVNMRSAQTTDSTGGGPIEALQSLPDRLAQFFDGYANDYPLRRDREEDADAADLAPRYVHLGQATIRQGGGPTIKVGEWRGRLAVVSGWSLGRID